MKIAERINSLLYRFNENTRVVFEKNEKNQGGNFYEIKYEDITCNINENIKTTCNNYVARSLFTSGDFYIPGIENMNYTVRRFKLKTDLYDSTYYCIFANNGAKTNDIVETYIELDREYYSQYKERYPLDSLEKYYPIYNRCTACWFSSAGSEYKQVYDIIGKDVKNCVVFKANMSKDLENMETMLSFIIFRTIQNYTFKTVTNTFYKSFRPKDTQNKTEMFEDEDCEEECEEECDDDSKECDNHSDDSDKDSQNESEECEEKYDDNESDECEDNECEDNEDEDNEECEDEEDIDKDEPREQPAIFRMETVFAT
jgi:hypothetical protein